MKPHAAKILLASISFATLASADASFNWVGGGFSSPGGTWSDHNNWNPVTTDFPSGTVTIAPSSTSSADVVLDIDASVGAFRISELPLGTGGKLQPIAILSIATTTFQTTGEAIGADFDSNKGQRGEIIQTGGSNLLQNSTNGFELGFGSNDFGEYQLSGAATLSVATTEEIGANGTGVFIQNGGYHEILRQGGFGSFFDVGTGTGSNGTYTLNDGTLVSNIGEFIGSQGSGTFIQTGGVNSLNGDIYVGDFNPGVGVYNQSGGTLNGATHVMHIAGLAGATGTYSISGGTATFDLVDAGGQFDTAGGPGVLNVSATANLTTGTLTVFDNASLFSMSGGKLTVGTIDLHHNTSLMHWTGGTIEITSDVNFSFDAPGPATNQAFGEGLTLFSGMSLVIDGAETLGNGPGDDAFTFVVDSGATHRANQITIQTGSILRVDAGGVLSAGSITNSGIATFTPDIGGGSIKPAVSAAGGSTTFAATQHLASLAVHNGAQVSVSADGSAVIETAALSFDGSADHWQGLLDLADNDMIVNNGSLTLIKNQIKQGKNGVAGLYSSTAGQSHLLVAIQNDNGSGSPFDTTFDGQTVSVADVLIKYTFPGDSNLDGNVDVTDLGALATNWQKSGTWIDGDFNDDGSVNVTDLGILASNWQAGVGNPQAMESFQQALTEVGLANTSVPEPFTLTTPLAILFLAVRKRRR